MSEEYPKIRPRMTLAYEVLKTMSMDDLQHSLNTTLAGIMHADQADAATDDLAKRIANFYTTVKASGMSDETASSITESFVSFEIGRAYGVNVAEVFGVAPGWED